MKINADRLNEILFILLFSITPLIYLPRSLGFHFLAKENFFYFILSLIIVNTLYLFWKGRIK
ncbi:MAG: hypothetical protein D6734_03845, partial [Candidatus Schekmanbacteria bacterium]